MSHGQTVIELSPGLTVLTGPNNCGKSAVVAALQILAANGKTNHVMRHGKKECRITVETEEADGSGHVLCWERKKNTVKYTLDGEDIHRIGQGIPPQLHELLRLDRVTAEAGKSQHEYDIHFGEQKSPVFLLNETGSRAASFFASSSDASRLVEMQHKHRSRLADAKKDANRLSKESNTNQAKLKAFEPLSEIEQRLIAAETVAKEIKDTDRKQERLQQLIQQLSQCRREHDRIGEQSRCLQPLLEPPALHAVETLRSLISNLQSRQFDSALATAILQLCVKLKMPPELEPTAACRAVAQQLETAERNCLTAERTAARLAALLPPPQQLDTTRLRSLIPSLETTATQNRFTQSQLSALLKLETPPMQVATDPLQQMIKRLRTQTALTATSDSAARCLQKLEPPFQPTDSKPLDAMLAMLEKSIATVAAAELEATKAAEGLLDCQQQIKTWVAANPKCATCGGSIDPETLMTSVPH